MYPVRFPTLMLLLKLRQSFGFSKGAPLSSCEDNMVPRHGFLAQKGDPPVEVVLDQYTSTSAKYIRVTIRSRRSFRGFMIRAENGLPLTKA